MKLTDELLERAVREAREQELSDLPVDGLPEHRFSRGFEKKMEKLIRKERSAETRKWRFFSGRTAAVCAAALVVMSMTVMSVDALRTRLFQMISTEHPEYTAITYEAAAGAEDAAEARTASSIENFQPYAPRDIPDGYRLDDKHDSQGGVRYLHYSKGETGSLMFSQHVLGSSTMGVDTENAEVKEIEVGDEKATYILKNDAQTIIWDNDFYSFVLIAQEPGHALTEKDVIRIAESVEPEK